MRAYIVVGPTNDQPRCFSALDSAVDAGTRNILLRARLQQHEGLLPGMFATLRLGYALHRSLDVQAACENLFDANYRVFASGVSAPGRNVRLTLRTRF